MFYWLLYEQLYPRVIRFRLFSYITFRTALASMTALFLCLALGPWLIGRLRQFQIGQHIARMVPIPPQKGGHADHGRGPHRDLNRGAHAAVGQPCQSVHLDRPVRHPEFWAIGFWDDYAKIRKKQNLGITGWRKFAAQCFGGAGDRVFLLVLRAQGAYSTSMNVPFFKSFKPGLGLNRCSIIPSPIL